MRKENAYPNPRPGEESPTPTPTPTPPPPPPPPPYKIPDFGQSDVGAWDAFKGGLQSGLSSGPLGKGISAQEWADSKLTPRQWTDKYQASYQDYRNWQRSVRERKPKHPKNWLQKMIWPIPTPSNFLR